MTIVKPFDWTYTTLHPGTTTCSSAESTKLEWKKAPPTHPGIPLALLARTDIPILFFDEVPLFEDELGDNGIADVTIRVVSCFLVYLPPGFETNEIPPETRPESQLDLVLRPSTLRPTDRSRFVPSL